MVRGIFFVLIAVALLGIGGIGALVWRGNERLLLTEVRLDALVEEQNAQDTQRLELQGEVRGNTDYVRRVEAELPRLQAAINRLSNEQIALDTEFSAQIRQLEAEFSDSIKSEDFSLTRQRVALERVLIRLEIAADPVMLRNGGREAKSLLLAADQILRQPSSAIPAGRVDRVAQAIKSDIQAIDRVQTQSVGEAQALLAQLQSYTLEVLEKADQLNKPISTPQTSASPTESLDALWSYVRGKLSHLVLIREVPKTDKAFLDSQDLSLLRAELNLRLQVAESALLLGDVGYWMGAMTGLEKTLTAIDLQLLQHEAVVSLRHAEPFAPIPVPNKALTRVSQVMQAMDANSASGKSNGP